MLQNRINVRAVLFFLGLPFLLSAQGLRLEGSVKEEGKVVANATVILNDSLRVPSNSFGFFSIGNLRKGQYKIEVVAMGFDHHKQWVNLQSDTILSPVLLIRKSHELQEVAVNAQVAAKKAKPLNIEQVGQAFIQRNLAGSLMETLQKLPGVNAMMIGSGQSKPQIRGLGFNQVVVVESGVKHEGQQWGADHGLEIDQFASGKVEIIKGAASFMYGSDAIGGIINVSPHAVPPLHTFGVNLNSSFMSNNSSVTNSLNISARQHHWYFDSRVTWRDYGDYRVPTERIFVYDYEVALPGGYIRNSAGRERNLHFSVGRVTEKMQTRLSVSNVYSKSGFFANAHGLEPRNVDAKLHDASHRDILLPYQQVNHLKVLSNTNFSLGKHELSIDVAYQNNHREEKSRYFNHGFMPSVFPFDISSDLERLYDKHVFSINAKDEIKTGRHEFSYGLNLEHQKNSIGGWGFLIPAFSQWQTGAFVYEKYKVSDNTLLHAALRYDFSSINIKEYTDWFPSQLEGTDERLNLTRVENYRKSFDNLSWSLGANHSIGKLDLRANIGTSFRMPLAKELAANGVNYHYFRYEKGNKDLSAERSYQVDLGVNWKNEKLSFELTPFFNYFPNYIYLNPTFRHDYSYGAGNQIFEYEQSRVMRYGGEVQLKWQFLPSFSSTLQGEYLYNRQLSGSKKGYNLPFSPPPGLIWNISYEPGNSYFSFDMRYKAEQNRIVPPEKVTPAYTLFDFSAGTYFKVREQKWNVSLQVNNLLDKKYLNHTSFYRLIDLPEMGRNIILTLKIPVLFVI